MNASANSILTVTVNSIPEDSPLLHIAPQKTTDIEADQLLAHFNQLNEYGRRCALAMMAGLARLNGGAA